jgi:hypothetical protein
MRRQTIVARSQTKKGSSDLTLVALGFRDEPVECSVIIGVVDEEEETLGEILVLT